MSKLKVNQIVPFNDFGVGVGAVNGEASSILNVQSTTQGVYLPKMTTAQRNSIPSPKDGLLIYNLDTHQYEHYDGSSWISVDGIQSLNGLIAKNQFLTNGSSGSSPNWTQTGGNTNQFNVPLANTSGVSAGLVSNGDWTSFQSRLFPQKNIKYVTKNSTLGLQDFNSVEDAMDSILDASVTNPYLVKIAPGIYVEDTISGKPYVSIVGDDTDSVIIEVNNPNKHVIIGENNFFLSNVTLRGATGANKYAIYYNPVTGSEVCSIENIRFGNNYGYIHLFSNVAGFVLLTANNLSLTLDTTPTTGFFVENSDTSQTTIILSGLVGVFFAPIQDFGFVTGTGSIISFDNVTAECFSGGRFVRAQNGGRIVGRNIAHQFFDVGAECSNVGAAPVIQMTGTATFSTTYDILISHPGTTGAVTGLFDGAKILVDPLSTVTFSYLDSVSPETGQIVLGDIIQGDRHDRRLSISKLVRETAPVGIYDGGGLTIVSGLNLSIAAGNGVLLDPIDEFMRPVAWSTITLSLSANSIFYIYVNSLGTVLTSSSPPDFLKNIIIGRVATSSSSIYLVDRSAISNVQMGTRIEQYQREAIGPIYSSGSLLSENGTRGLNASSGLYYFGNTRFTPSGGTALTWESYYKDGSGGFLSNSQSTVSNSQYDDGSGTLASLTSSYYAKHSIYLVGDGVDEKYYLVYSQAQYSALILAQQGNVPSPPAAFVEAVTLISTIIVQQGVANIAEIRDERPIIGFKASGISASTFHGNLLGLLNDDHPQYLPVSGSRAMSGSLNLGNNHIINALDINGIDIAAHSSRHLPNGADPLTTAAPPSNLTSTTTNSVGTANSLSRSDHFHALTTGAPTSQFPDQTNTTGTGAPLARADHVHNISTAAPIGTIGASTTNSQGISATFTRSDHQHQVATGTPATITPDQSNNAGSSNNLTRADHIHSIATAIALTINTVNSQGSSTSFSRADHIHAHGSQTNPTLHAIATTSANGFMSSADKVKLDGIGGSRIIKSGNVLAASFSGTPKKFSLVFGSPFADTNYSIALTGVDGRILTYESKLATGFTINTNANTALAGEVSWTAMNNGEMVE